jgi:hypothetical protein
MPDMIRMIQDIQRWKKRDWASDHITVLSVQGKEKLRDIAPKPHRKIKKTRACRFLVGTIQNETISGLRACWDFSNRSANCTFSLILRPENPHLALAKLRFSGLV